MSRMHDIRTVRDWLLQGRAADPMMEAVIGRVCDHAENSTQALSRDWGAVRAQAAVMLLVRYDVHDVDTAIKQADELVEQLRKTEQ